MKDKKIKYIFEDYKYFYYFGCDTDFSKYKYGRSFSLFKIGSFRGKEDKSVLMITDLNKTKDYRYKYIDFNTEKEGLKFIFNAITELKALKVNFTLKKLMKDAS